MEWLAAPSSSIARILLERGIAGIYVLAFLVAANQFPALAGERGLLPVRDFLAAVPPRRAPSLFHWRYSDRLLRGVARTGIGLAAALALGLPQQGPAWVPLLVWLTVWALYLSIVNVGQVFWGYGWESILLEAGFLASFLGSASSAPPVATIVLFRWLTFRVEFGAGLIKIRGDQCWRDLTCLEHHHETQPLPGPFSWHFHRLPRWAHKVEVAANHVTQLVVPVGLFLPQPVASIAASIIIGTQSWLILSGNFSWLNVLTIVLATSALGDDVIEAVLSVDAPMTSATPAVWLLVVSAAVALAVAVMSWWPVRNMLSPRQAMNRSFNPLHLVNTYGAFGSITRTRYEIVLEGTDDGETWQEYGFKGKPTDPSRRPRQIAPYHLRLDWQLWFAAMAPRPRRRWFSRLVQRLLVNDPDTVALLRHNPFEDEPPAAVRARRARYRYTTREERRATGDWWRREFVGDFLAPVGHTPDGDPSETGPWWVNRA